MKCPRCLRPDLVRETVGDFAVDKCPQCQGLWFGVGELDQVLAQTHDHTRRRVSKPVESVNVDSPLECPSCGAGARLIRIRAPGNTKVVFDGCQVCHGRWLDGGELAQLGDPGVLDRLRTVIKAWF